VSAADPASFGASALLFAAIAALASYPRHRPRAESSPPLRDCTQIPENLYKNSWL
jgi:hypothetical protein